MVYKGAANIAEIAARLIAHGMPGDLTAVAVASASTPRECRIVAHLAAIAQSVRAAEPSGPVLFIIGRAVSLYPACPVENLVPHARLREVLHA
ncbi:MAG: hypothetical protein AAGF49_06375 [Pseudomonadota bacterium]